MTETNNSPTPDLDRMIEQEGRRLLEARMLPNDGPLTPQQRSGVVDAVNAYIVKHNLKQNAVAKQVPAVGTANLNAILLGKYLHGPLDDHLRELNNWMEVDARRRLTKPDREFVETGVAKLLLGAADKASKGPYMVIAHGPTGIGKTMVGHVIAERFPGAIYMRISSGNTSYTALRRMLAMRLRMYGRKRKKGETTQLTFDERIFDKLRDSGRLLIIDEAHRISDTGLEFIRDIHDECLVPVLFLCTKDLVDRIRRDADEDHGQLHSRFAYTVDLTRRHTTSNDPKRRTITTRRLFTLAEIRKLFESDKVRLDPGAQAFLLDVANDFGQGSLRECEHMMSFAVALARVVKGGGPGTPVLITDQLLRKVECESRADRDLLADIENRHTAQITKTGTGSQP